MGAQDRRPLVHLPRATGSHTGERALATAIAVGLAAAVNLGGIFTATVDATLPRITIEDATPSTVDPFTVEVRRGAGSVTGAFDVDNGNLASGSLTVPVLLPGSEFLVSLYPYLLPFFQVPDQLDYVARPVLQVFNADGSPHACTTPAGLDPGSTSRAPITNLPTDPFLVCTFTSAETYTVRVGSFLDFANGRASTEPRHPPRTASSGSPTASSTT